MKNKSLFYILIFMIITLGLIFFLKDEFSFSKKYKVAIILPLTGKLAFMGEQEKKGMELAIKELNSKKNIEFYFEDSKSDPKEAVTVALKQIQINHVNCIITSTTGASKAVQPIAEKNNVDLIAFCMDPTIANNSKYVSRLYESTDEEAEAFVSYINNNSIKRIAILYNKVDAWQKAVDTKLIPVLKEKNINLVFNEQYAVGEKDLRNIVTKLKASNADHLILLSYGFEYPILIPMLKEYRIFPNTKILGGWGFLYPQMNKNLLNGIYVSGPEYVFRKDKLASEFIDLYKSNYKSTPNYDAAMAYNTIWLIMKYHNIKGDRLKNKLKNIKIQESVIGPYEIDNNGAMILKTTLGVYNNGEIIMSK